MSESQTNPYLQGNFAPWRLEGDATDLEVVGEIPKDLNGVFYRNGPNPAYEPVGRYHWFDGDGMIHAITLRDGRASYRNRYVQSRGLLEERAAGQAKFKGLLELSATEAPVFKNTANTNIVCHARKLLALMEGALPTQLMPGSLETVGEYDFGGKLQTAMTAHPKMDPQTGEMLFFGYSPFPPYLTYHVANRTGELLRSEAIDLEWPSMIHDFAVTKDYVIFMLFPLVFSFEELAKSGAAFAWQPERGSRIGIMPRSGGNADVKWIETEACYVFHPMNAYAENGQVVIDAPRFPRLLFMNPGDNRSEDTALMNDAPMLHRWRIGVKDGSVKLEQRDDLPCEFPRIDERLLGSKHRVGYAAASDGAGGDKRAPVFNAVVRHDFDKGTRQVRRFGPLDGVGEPLFVERNQSAGEEDGYVLVLQYDSASNTSQFHILDAQNINAEPVATVMLPHRIPYGFHGNWVPQSA